MTEINYNTSKNNRYLLQILGFKNLSFKCQTASIGALNLGGSPFETRSASIFVPSNKIDFTFMSVRVLVNENYDEWMDCVEWAFDTTKTNDSHISSETVAILTLLNSNNVPVMEVNYKGVAFSAITEIDYDLTQEEQTNTFDLSLSYDYYNVKNLITGKEIVYSE